MEAAPEGSWSGVRQLEQSMSSMIALGERERERFDYGGDSVI